MAIGSAELGSVEAALGALSVDDELASLSSLDIRLAPALEAELDTVQVQGLSPIDDTTRTAIAPAIHQIQRVRRHLLQPSSVGINAVYLLALRGHFDLEEIERRGCSLPTQEEIQELVRDEFPAIVLHYTEARAVTADVELELGVRFEKVLVSKEWCHTFLASLDAPDGVFQRKWWSGATIWKDPEGSVCSRVNRKIVIDDVNESLRLMAEDNYQLPNRCGRR
ncbi:uncharacterized protein LOC62_05G007243 [Vanrija pseudolonga]|uniref:Uncharacterized protein n=1 Tax=Vanrija pseudolonga TaxID=143232 RepID=A0AAF0YC34_9TREE|nr:hypothetical protein LOC62_05G007243 [Vanrija pseudolonga]